MDDFLHDLDWVVPLRHPALTPVIEGFTELGHAPFFVVLLPLLYWTWRKPATHRLAVLLLLSGLLNMYLKDWFQDPRPKAFFMPGHGSDSFGLPSGHTQMAIVFWFALAEEIRKRWAWIAASILVVGITFSRLYLGVHDVEDILGGALLGVFTLGLYWSLRSRLARLPRPRVFGALGLVILLGFLLAWPKPIALPDMAVVLYGFLVGWCAGVCLERDRLRFGRASRIGRILLSIVIGFVAIALAAGVLLLTLKPLIDAGLLLDYFALAAGGIAVGFTSTFGAPWLLVRFGLMSRGTASPR